MGSHDRATLMIADPARIPATAPLAELACATTTPTGPEADHATVSTKVRRTAGRILSGGVRRGLRSVHPADRQPDPDRERHRRGGPPRLRSVRPGAHQPGEDRHHHTHPDHDQQAEARAGRTLPLSEAFLRQRHFSSRHAAVNQAPAHTDRSPRRWPCHHACGHSSAATGTLGAQPMLR